MSKSLNVASTIENVDETGIVLRQWDLHQLRETPQRMAPILALSIFVFVAGYINFHSIWPSVAAIVMLLGSASEYLMPAKYTLTKSGASAVFGISRFEIAWTDVKRLLISESSVTLSPLAKPSRLDSFRGVTLRFTDSDSFKKDEILAEIEAQVAQARSKTRD